MFVPTSSLTDIRTAQHSTHSEDALRRQIGKKAKKICPTIKRRKSLATKLILAATPALVISPYASQLWIDLDLYLGHINATSETTTAGVCT